MRIQVPQMCQIIGCSVLKVFQGLPSCFSALNKRLNIHWLTETKKKRVTLYSDCCDSKRCISISNWILKFHIGTDKILSQIMGIPQKILNWKISLPALLEDVILGILGKIKILQLWKIFFAPHSFLRRIVFCWSNTYTWLRSLSSQVHVDLGEITLCGTDLSGLLLFAFISLNF